MSYELNEWKQIQKIAEELKRIADAQDIQANAALYQTIALGKITDKLVLIAKGIERLSDPTSFKVNERSLDGSPTKTSNLQGENTMSPFESRNRLADSRQRQGRVVYRPAGEGRITDCAPAEHTASSYQRYGWRQSLDGPDCRSDAGRHDWVVVHWQHCAATSRC